MSLKFENHNYSRVKEDARYIAEIATKLETIKTLDEQGVLKPSSIHESFEKRQLRDIKNALSNIYLILELHDITGMADQIFNKEFRQD